MLDWRAEELAAIAARLGLPTDDLSPPRELSLRTPASVGIAALDWGGDGPPAVLLHGGSLTCRTWDYLALALRRRFRLIAPDLRGHGDSDWTDDYAIEAYAADMLALLDSLDLGPVHLAGMSLGGLVACELALAHPERVASLAMIDVGPGVSVGASARMRSFIGDFAGADTLDEVVEMAMAVSPLSDPERVRYRMATLLKRGPDGRLMWKRDPRHTELQRVVDRLQSLDDRVGGLAAPFLLARGGRSRILSAEAAQAFAARFPNGRAVDIADAGHNVQEDNPRDLAAALRGFWSANRDAAAEAPAPDRATEIKQAAGGRLTAPDLGRRKRGEPIVMLTAYTARMAELLDPHCDALLVGDSLGQVVYGLPTTLPVTLEMMAAHGAAVVRGSKRALVVIDLPFASYEEGPEQAFRAASWLLKQTGAGAVKLEGGVRLAPTVAFLTARGIPVMGHVGVTPQSVHTLGGYRSRGRRNAEFAEIVEDAKALGDAGAFAIVLEAVVERLARSITETVECPTIGIGASGACDGQILVVDDMLGLTGTVARFVKRYDDLAGRVDVAAAAYAQSVRSRAFPEPRNLY